MIDHIIFDLDGTLIDSAAHCADILTQMHQDRGSDRRITDAEVTPYLTIGGAAMVAALLGDLCGDEAADAGEFRQRYATCPTPAGTLFSGVADGLRDLHGAGFTLAICSNKPQHLCEKVMADLDLAGLFGAIVGTVPGRRAKPETDLLDVALDRLGARADQCLFVGDSRLDHEIASARGVDFVHMTYGYAEADWAYLDGPRYDGFADLVSVLCGPAFQRPVVVLPTAR